MFYNILDKQRIDLLPSFRPLKEDFYLAGGTALALQIGHRDSVDFDFFKHGNLDTKKLYENLQEIFVGHKLLRVQDERNTLSIIIDSVVKASFFGYKYNLIDDQIDENDLTLASVLDIGCMKLSAVTGRASNKDYIDLYYILHDIPLADLLNKTSEKFPDLDRNLILKSLVYFEDVEVEPIKFKNENSIAMQEVEIFLKKEVKKLA